MVELDLDTPPLLHSACDPLLTDKTKYTLMTPLLEAALSFAMAAIIDTMLILTYTILQLLATNCLRSCIRRTVLGSSVPSIVTPACLKTWAATTYNEHAQAPITRALLVQYKRLLSTHRILDDLVNPDHVENTTTPRV